MEVGGSLRSQFSPSTLYMGSKDQTQGVRHVQPTPYLLISPALGLVSGLEGTGFPNTIY